MMIAIVQMMIHFQEALKSKKGNGKLQILICLWLFVPD